MLKKDNAITLIALIITIIVMLILVAVSISILINSGLIGKAKEAGEKTEISKVVESAKLDIVAQIAENKGENISKEQLATILNKQFKTVDADSIPDEISSEHDLELTTIDNKYKINLSEIYSGVMNLEENNMRMISFEISTSSANPIELRCEEGMTWEEWAREFDDPIYLPLGADQSAHKCGYFNGSLQDFILFLGTGENMYYTDSYYMQTQIRTSDYESVKTSDTIKDVSEGGSYLVYGGYDG